MATKPKDHRYLVRLNTSGASFLDGATYDLYDHEDVLMMLQGMQVLFEEAMISVTLTAFPQPADAEAT